MLGNISSWRRSVFAYRTATAVYHNLPLKYSQKRRLKTYVYKLLRLIDRITANQQRRRASRSNDWSGRITPASFQQLDKTPEGSDRAILRPAALGHANRGTEDLRQHGAAGSSQKWDEGPEVSVIIPVYDQLDYTLQCLESIAATPAER